MGANGFTSRFGIVVFQCFDNIQMLVGIGLDPIGQLRDRKFMCPQKF